jgi:penicillin-binding protein 1C
VYAVKPLKFTRGKIIRYTLAGLLVWYLFCLPRKLFDTNYSTVVCDRNGELLGARTAADGQWRFPPSDSVPDKFRRCIIAFEDKRFEYHIGFDPLAFGRAVWQNVTQKRIVSGGSTLTMQTVRLSRGKRRTVGEKIIEIILATRLECRHSKSEILALYASHAPFGGNVVGLEAAAWRYFGHDADRLSWAEAATLAVLPNAPSMIHLSRNRAELTAKRNRLLKMLHNKGDIDDVDYDLALGEELPGEPLSLPQIAPHLVAWCHKHAAGQHIITDIDRDIQLQTESILERWHTQFARNDIRNLAAMIIDVPENKVIAYCGNVKFNSETSANQVDIILSPRSSGSILKPFLYCAALEEGLILPNTLLPDIPLNINGFAPQNFNMQYDGAVPASKVISRSLNVPSVWLLREYGVPKFYDYLKDSGFSTLTRSPSVYGLSLILGGAEITLSDVTHAYARMANTRNDGAIWLVFEALKEANRPEEIDWRYITSMQTVAWKTGTSYGFRDAWAVGVTSRYAVGVWVGNANGEGKPEIVGARTAGPVMFDIFNILPSSPWFERPTELFVEAEVCRRSGHLKGRFCDEADTVLILPAGLNTDACPYHTNVCLTADRKYRVLEDCISENESIVRDNYFVLPPVWAWYYRQHNPEYRVLPPFTKGCGGEATTAMAFIYPQPNAHIHIPRQLDGSEGEITFELAHNNPSATVFWHIDTDYLGVTRDFHKLTFRPSIGRHTVTTVDNQGNTISIGFAIE